MANTTNRIATLNNNGINTGKYFSFNLPEGLQPGATITLAINDEGMAELVEDIKKGIDEGDYVGNGRLFRRWVMAQTFRMLNWKSWRGDREGYDACLTDTYSFQYQFKMMLDEVHRLAKMEKSGGEDFRIQATFFTKDVVVKTCKNYLFQLKKHANGLKVKRCKRVPYKHICGRDIFLTDLETEYKEIETAINRMQKAKSYGALERQLVAFMDGMFKLPYDTKKSDAWKSAFKGVGGYYTLQNLIRFHGVRIHEDGNVLSRAESEAYLERKREEYTGEGYRLIGLLKEVVRYNNFDFGKRMAELHQ